MTVTEAEESVLAAIVHAVRDLSPEEYGEFLDWLRAEVNIRQTGLEDDLANDD